ncbi:MAG TPA: PAS domain S-box protein [Opitutaceae bacterium]|nr:PAS domain S-box protein [Opitutaceae bacterium]
MPRAYPTTEPSTVEVFDRLLLWFSPVALAGIVVAWPSNARLGTAWVCVVLGAELGIGVLVSLLRRHLRPSLRLATYSLCFVLAGAAEAFAVGVLGAGLLFTFLGILLASVARCNWVRWLTITAAAVLLGAATVLHGFGWLVTRDIAQYAASPWTGASALLLLAFAGMVVVFWSRLSDGLFRANEDRRLAEEHFQMIFEIAGDAALIFEEGRLVAANAQAEVAFGHGADELRGLAWELLSPDRQANGRSSVDESRRIFAAASEGTQHFRWLHRRRDGRLFEAEVALSSALFGQRRIHLAIVHDLSDYRIVERENRLLATALSHASEAVAITDAAGQVVYVNRAFEVITGYSRHEVHGRNLRLLKSGRHDAAFYRELWTTITAGQVWRGRLENRRKDGTFFTETTCITPLRDERGVISHFVAVKRDISHELELEDQLVQSRKMEAVGRLAGGIAHDFNNILQVITGNVAMAALDAPAGHPVHASLDEIARASDRAVNLVQQLLAFSRRETLKLRPVELGGLIGEASRMLRRLIGEDIALAVQTGGKPLHVLADPVRVEQILLNLCVNSRDAMPDGGRITIEAEALEIDDAFCANRPEAKPGSYIAVAVTDDGCGIPKEIQHRIFEPFFSTKEVGRGTGLGLATVYAIVRQHGGFINLYSEVGLGTTFRFYLPAAPAPEAVAPAAAQTDVAALHSRGETILIAEDDEQVLAIAHRVLAQAGYRVLTAKSGDEALALHEGRDGPIHLAILDVVMPHRNGRLTHDELRRRDPALPVLFATGYSYHHLQDGLIEQEQVLRKPFTHRELLVRVRSAIDGKPEGMVATAT